MRNLSGWCFRLAVLYALFGMVMGEIMGASGDHGLMPVHAHINLLGWVCLALFGVFYKLWPVAAAGRLPLIQFGLFNVGVVVQAAGVWLVLSGNGGAGPIAGIGSGFLIISMAIFAFLVYRHATE